MQEARCGHSVVRRGQEQARGPHTTCLRIAVVNQGEELLKAVQSALGKPTSSGDRWPLSQTTLSPLILSCTTELSHSHR